MAIFNMSNGTWYPNGDQIEFQGLPNPYCPKCGSRMEFMPGEKENTHRLYCPSCYYVDLNSEQPHTIATKEQGAVEYCSICNQYLSRKTKCPTIDGDYLWTEKDIKIILKIAATGEYPPEVTNPEYADLNGDGDVTGEDSAVANGYLTGLQEDPYNNE